jgi:hypothetical protein
MFAFIQPHESKRPHPAWHAKFIKMLPSIRRTAQIAFRKVCPELRQELIQEVIANCLVAYARLAKLGKEDLAFPTPLARFAVAQARVGRRVGSSLKIRDVLSGYAQHHKGFQVERLDHFDDDENCWQEIVVEDKRATPAEIAACRIDFAEWIRRLPNRQRKIAMTLATGETTQAAAKKYAVSPARISQIRQLLKESWERFQGEGKAAEPQLAVA